MKKKLKFIPFLLTEEESKKLATFIVVEIVKTYEFANKLFGKNIQMTEEEKIEDYLIYKGKAMMKLELLEHDYDLVVRFDVGYTSKGTLNHFTESYVVSKDFNEIINVTREDFEVLPGTLAEAKKK